MHAVTDYLYRERNAEAPKKCQNSGVHSDNSCTSEHGLSCVCITQDGRDFPAELLRQGFHSSELEPTKLPKDLTDPQNVAVIHFDSLQLAKEKTLDSATAHS